MEYFIQSNSEIIERLRNYKFILVIIYSHYPDKPFNTLTFILILILLKARAGNRAILSSKNKMQKWRSRQTSETNIVWDQPKVEMSRKGVVLVLLLGTPFSI